ncbi:hypothetical protein [Candidatus Nanohalococcus occultus]|uniref:hypothetical protein n=1 Tax=Candidatus Nanohalococcus occultus TaxID=2978047 RepID=UPI0039DFEA9C
METYEHAAISAIAAPIAVWQIFGFSQHFVPLSLFGFFLGVFIDLDHFLVQRLRDGNWNHLKTAFSDVRTITTDNGAALEDRIPNWSRYLSHFAILATAPVLFAAFSFRLAALTYTMLGAHIFCDIVRSWQDDALGFD